MIAPAVIPANIRPPGGVAAKTALSGPPDHISPTSAKAYLACPLKFFLEKVMKLKKPVPVALHCGKAIHAGLQAFHLARWRGEDDSPEAVSAAFGESFVALERDEGPVNYPDAASREKARQDGLRVLAAYLDSPEVLRGKPRAVEVLLSEEIDGLPVRLTGAMDLVRGDLTPVDFKSAASRPDPGQAAFDHELQLVCYQLLLEAATGEKPPGLEVVCLVKTKSPQVVRVPVKPAGPRRKERVKAMLRAAVEGIAAGRFHPQPGMHCSWCQFRRECSAWTGGGR